MAKKKASILDFDNTSNVEIISSKEITPNIISNSHNNILRDNKDTTSIASTNTSSTVIDSPSILDSVLSKTIKEPKKTYTGFYLEEPIIKTINKIVKENKDTNKSKLVNDLLKEAFKQAGLL
ncbi:hypothetical protein Q0N88_23840 [Bacillus thuringiensis]|uniref:hypothetical protein n=1 Tax=Bacillus thuringiensis TaxID=1428 RepID=UPI0018CE370D|nr:hypothetical protein [Bacillus thuringiensis]MEB9334434.1 hypothetical protein [Bacillus cereus]HEF1856752.1 hypothetical protein [Bacillus cereus]HEF1869116.1 hypothetical protein [Bacillus cereus]HEF1879640.1 hypothetical protein [Bacillus cereus]HEF1885701.1 hypothetical protein [Bacillus cereus]